MRLPISYGPDAVCLRLDNGERTFRVPWVTLGCAVSGRDTYNVEAVTVHHQLDGTISVSVDDDELKVFSPSSFAELCEQAGDLVQ
jgi:hypothetical protein